MTIYSEWRCGKWKERMSIKKRIQTLEMLHVPCQNLPYQIPINAGQPITNFREKNRGWEGQKKEGKISKTKNEREQQIRADIVPVFGEYAAHGSPQAQVQCPEKDRQQGLGPAEVSIMTKALCTELQNLKFYMGEKMG